MSETIRTEGFLNPVDDETSATWPVQFDCYKPPLVVEIPKDSLREAGVKLAVDQMVCVTVNPRATTPDEVKPHELETFIKLRSLPQELGFLAG
jgi:hypothetical protein